jgi:hypothetical protein
MSVLRLPARRDGAFGPYQAGATAAFLPTQTSFRLGSDFVAEALGLLINGVT